MISYPMPLSEAFISLSPEGWPGDCCEWLIAERESESPVETEGVRTDGPAQTE
jgi:hypothetical protein